MSLNRTLAGLIDAAGDVKSASLDNAGLSTYSSLDSLPTSSLTVGDQAFVTGNQRFYISNGSGWYNAALLNATPRWYTEPANTASIVDSATPLNVYAKAADSDNAVANLFNQSFASDSAQYLVNITNDSSVFTFTPISADSLGINATAGNLADSNGGSFTYTYKWSDGISFVSKAQVITYQLADLTPFADLFTTSMPHSGINIDEASHRGDADDFEGMTLNNITTTSSGFGAHDGHEGSPNDWPAYLAVYIGGVYPNGKAINRLQFSVHANHFGNFELQGSNDANTSGTFYNTGNWTALTFNSSGSTYSTQNGGGNSSGNSDGTVITFNYDNDTTYTHYRIWIKDISNPGSSGAYNGWASYGWRASRVV